MVMFAVQDDVGDTHTSTHTHTNFNNFCVLVGETMLSYHLLSDPFGSYSGVAKVLFNALANAYASSGQWRESLLVCSEAGSGCHQIRILIRN